ncbi:unnamed protein product [Spirodela intermedia]|uniref:Uncharacterized protein n=2 Tax=Spirodela intermedia TaxID=51605 RepID=A0A7I8K802_SPIIN|nr:unnamed protein product [Spirodela intermedia]CAA6656924.1 unnamed protein product [Spirodela intermedia]CAA7392883.1 unnamed protein product [Spirodela intermedia]
MVKLTRRSTSVSWLTSQCTKVTDGERDAAKCSPAMSSTSATTTLAPCQTNSLAVASPMPLDPPVTTATLPSSLCQPVQLSYRGCPHGDHLLQFS